MKIIYNKNPLRTTIELDRYDKILLKERIKSEMLEEVLFSIGYCLEHDRLEDAKSRLSFFYNEDDEVVDERIEENADRCIKELSSEHCGDCTCVATSCSKCHVEYLLGINTIKGLGSHEANAIASAFDNKNETTIDEAIRSLINYRPGNDSDLEIEHGPRWLKEHQNAARWLIEYKEKHGL